MNEDLDQWLAAQERRMAWVTMSILAATSFGVGLVLMADTTAGWAVFGGM